MRYLEKFLPIWKDADPGIPDVEDARSMVAGLKGKLPSKQRVGSSSLSRRARLTPYFSVVFRRYDIHSAYAILSFFDTKTSKERQI